MAIPVEAVVATTTIPEGEVEALPAIVITVDRYVCRRYSYLFLLPIVYCICAISKHIQSYRNSSKVVETCADLTFFSIFFLSISR